MAAKLLLWVCITCGGALGFLPTLWGSDDLTLSIFLSVIGGFVGIWFWYKFLRLF